VKTELQENNSRQAYTIVIPRGAADTTSFELIWTGTDGNGYGGNFAFSVWGPEDPTGVTLPVALTIVGPTFTDQLHLLEDDR
jgi:hypothetical protein